LKNEKNTWDLRATVESQEIFKFLLFSNLMRTWQ